MTDVLKPRDAKEVEDAVCWALSHERALEVAGQGSKRGIGRPSQTDATLDLSGLTGVTLYELLTGTLPFSAMDPMEWAHCHIARMPPAPSARKLGIPIRFIGIGEGPEDFGEFDAEAFAAALVGASSLPSPPSSGERAG